MLSFILSGYQSLINWTGWSAFWPALEAIATTVGIIFIYIQVKTTGKITSYDFLREEDDRFRTNEMKIHRSNLAIVLLKYPLDHKAIDAYSDFVLDYFEDFGIMLTRKIAKAEIIWSMNAYYILRYWQIMESHIRFIRKKLNNPTWYTEFQNLYKIIMEIELKETGKRKIVYSRQELRHFLIEEMMRPEDIIKHLSVRNYRPEDFERVVEINRYLSQKSRSESLKDIQKILSRHGDHFKVATVYGEVVGFSGKDNLLIDSIRYLDIRKIL